jgi:hypothetical protein
LSEPVGPLDSLRHPRVRRPPHLRPPAAPDNAALGFKTLLARELDEVGVALAAAAAAYDLIGLMTRDGPPHP